ncbi:MAG TPA: OmpA family protein [Polyangiaceae bacterium]|nr:OmpA family protein [Polyangiaceae bacterium]
MLVLFDQAQCSNRHRFKCLSEGPLKGRAMTIIGRTDPRGSAAYNKQLSANRAEAARNYLVQRGVATSNIRIVARGEQGAMARTKRPGRSIDASTSSWEMPTWPARRRRTT